MTCYITVNKGQDDRGQRGVEIDSKEFIALRNLIQFNTKDAFYSSKDLRITPGSFKNLKSDDHTPNFRDSPRNFQETAKGDTNTIPQQTR